MAKANQKFQHVDIIRVLKDEKASLHDPTKLPGLLRNKITNPSYKQQKKIEKQKKEQKRKERKAYNQSRFKHKGKKGRYR